MGIQPESVNIGGKKLKVEVPRVQNEETGEFRPLGSYQELKNLDGPDEQTMQGVLHDLSTHDYKGVIDYLKRRFWTESQFNYF